MPNLYDLFESINLQSLNSYVENHQEEHLFLEFKRAQSDFTRDDRKNFAKALSGFANSSGGLIVWGIRAEKNELGLDCAIEKIAIQPLLVFLAKLNEFTGTAISPIVEGVQHKVIIENDDSGYAITYVPESNSGPYMAKLGEDRYYKRSGSSFYCMEHFDLEDMFGRRQKPCLSLCLHLVQRGYSTSNGIYTFNINIIVGIKNTGRGVAKYPLLRLMTTSRHRPSEYGLDGNGHNGLPIIPNHGSSDYVEYGADSNIVIHPKTILEVTSFNLKIHQDSTTCEDIILGYELVAEGIDLIAGETRITSEQQIEFMKKQKARLSK